MLPEHGRVDCALCHQGQAFDFDRTRTEIDGWRITNNPMAWGNPRPEVLVLGFSKGPEQAGALASQSHDAIAFRKGRTNLAKILHHVGLLPAPDPVLVDRAIADRNGRFHFGSLIRCTVERFEPKTATWTGTGGGMLDRFTASQLGKIVVPNCAKRFLSPLPVETKLVVMLGMGSKGSYIRASREAYEEARQGSWRIINDVAYTDDRITVVHTEHFASQGALLPNWLSEATHPRGSLGIQAREAVGLALGGQMT